MGRVHTGATATGLPYIDVLSHAETADPSATHQRFVPCEGQHINVHLLHVDWDHARGLGRVDGKDDIPLAADPADLLRRLHGADDVRAVVDDDQLGVGPDCLRNVGGIDEPGTIEGNKGRSHATIAHQVVDGAEHRVVLEVGGDHVISLGQQSKDEQV